MKKGIRFTLILLVMAIMFSGCGKTQTKVIEYNIDDFIIIYQAMKEVADEATKYATDDEERTDKYYKAMQQATAEAGFNKGDIIVISGKLHSVEKYPDLCKINVTDDDSVRDKDAFCFDSYILESKSVLIPQDTIVKVQIEVNEDGVFDNDTLLYPNLDDYKYENNVSDFNDVSLLEQIIQGEVIRIIEFKEEDELWDMYLDEEDEETQEYIRCAMNSTYRIVLGDSDGNEVSCLVDTEEGEIISVGDYLAVRGYVKHYGDEHSLYVSTNYYVFNE